MIIIKDVKFYFYKNEIYKKLILDFIVFFK